MWMKVDDKLHDHPKVHDLLEQGRGEALFLWVLAGSWVGDQLADGRVSGYVLGRFDPDWRLHASWLVDAGLWAEHEVGGRPVFEFHDWLEYNDSKEKVLADREAWRVRQALSRDPDLKQAIRERDGDRCRYCGSMVEWANRRGLAGGTYDHVKPVAEGGTNTLANVVTCCRRCNGRKGKRSLRDAGMKLLSPGSLGLLVLDEGAEENPVTSERGVDSGSGRVGSGAGDTPETSLDRDHPADPEADR